MYSTIALSDQPTPSPTAERACDRCRSFKIKCRSLKSPDQTGRPVWPCDHCRRTGSTCRYQEKRPKRGRPRKQDSRLFNKLCNETVLDFEHSFAAKTRTAINESTAVHPNGTVVQAFDFVPGPTQRGDLSTEINLHPVHSLDGALGVCVYTAPDFTAESHLSHGLTPIDWSPIPLRPPFPPGLTTLELQNIPEILDVSASAAPVVFIQDSPPCLGAQPVFESVQEAGICQNLQQFFETVHAIFPVFSHDDLLSRIMLQPDWSAAPELSALLLAMQLATAAGEFRLTNGDQGALKHLIKRVEKARLCYDFAEAPTLDEVAISLFLFTSYNVLGKHNRAFLYLDEALSLMETVRVVADEDAKRLIRFEQVLYNTEAASLAIYAGKPRRCRARRPQLHFDYASIKSSKFETNEDYENLALHLLERLTQIHTAEDSQALQILESTSEVDMNTLFGAALGMRRYCRIQAADVAVTRQWQLSSKLVTSLRAQRPTSEISQSLVDNLGTPALAWICMLPAGELRIVGLGKLSGLAKNIAKLSSGKTPSYSVAGLVGTIIKEDIEKTYAPELADVILPMVISQVPLSLQPPAGKDAERKSGSEVSCHLRSGTHSVLPPAVSSNAIIATDEEVGEMDFEDLDWCIDLTRLFEKP